MSFSSTQSIVILEAFLSPLAVPRGNLSQQSSNFSEFHLHQKIRQRVQSGASMSALSFSRGNGCNCSTDELCPGVNSDGMKQSQYFCTHECIGPRKQAENRSSPARSPRHLRSSSHFLFYYLKLRALISSQINKFHSCSLVQVAAARKI